MNMMETKRTIIAAILAALPFVAQAQFMELNCWTMRGESSTLTTEDAMLKIPDTIAALDLRGVEAINLDRSSASPNCLYYTDDATVVEGLPNANVICNGVCDGLLLTDEACFYCPMAFTATDAMLRLAPRLDEDDDEATPNQPCHETVILPFDADFVIPADVNGPMPEGWMQVAYYEGYDNNKLFFGLEKPDQLHANKPYLVQFAYGAYGTKILFCGQDKTVEETKTTIEGDETYSFVGTTMSKDEEPGYFRYHRGQEGYFIHTGDGMPMEPFRCFVVSTDTDAINTLPADGSGQILEYTVFKEEPDKIDTVSNFDSSKKYHDLLGRPVTNSKTVRGIRIAKGVKILK